jgi:hypothetical protein
MTAPDSSSTARADAPSRRSPAVVAAIVIVVVVVLAGGAFVVYKLTDKKSFGDPPYKVAKTVFAAAEKGDRAVLADNSTAAGTSQLQALDAKSLQGMTFAKCAPFAGAKPTRLCTYTRPGGQLLLRLVVVDSAWKVDQATLGAAAVTPTSGVSTPTT